MLITSRMEIINTILERECFNKATMRILTLRYRSILFEARTYALQRKLFKSSAVFTVLLIMSIIFLTSKGKGRTFFALSIKSSR